MAAARSLTAAGPLSFIELPAAVLSDDGEVELRLALVAQRDAPALAVAGERESEVGETIVAEHPREIGVRLREILRPITLSGIVPDAARVRVLEGGEVAGLCGLEDGQQGRGLRHSRVLRRRAERDEQCGRTAPYIKSRTDSATTSSG